MSHVWGQTIPSNYGRLNPSAQREYNAGEKLIVGDAAGEAAEKALKELFEEMQEKVGKAAFEKIQKKVSKEVGEDVSAEIMEKAMKETMEGLADGASSATIEKALKKNVKRLTKESTQKIAKKTGKDGVEKAVKELPEGAVERIGKKTIKYGAAGVTGVVMFNSLLNSDALDAWVKSSTGADCDEKAEAASLEPGTEEFIEHVTECQEKAAESLGMIGKIVTYGGIAVGGLLAITILSKIGLFSGSKV